MINTIQQIREQAKQRQKVSSERIKIYFLFKWMVFSYNLNLRELIDWDNYLKLRV